MIKKITTLLLTILLLVCMQQTRAEEGEKLKIYINQLVEHPALNATTKGVVDGLAEAGYKDGKNIELKIEYANGNASIAGQIASRFISKDPDIVVGVATISAQSMVKYARNGSTKLVFTTVTDPLGAGIVRSLEKPGGNISGVSNFVPLEPQLELFKKIKPSIKKLGFIYNPGELNSVSLIEKLKIACPKYGMELVTIASNKSSEVAQSAIKLASEVDAIYISNDNTALSAFQVIVKAADEVQIPVFVSDTDIVSQGAVAALGPNQYEIGKQTAAMVVRALKGQDLGETPVEFPAKTELFLNPAKAEGLGLDFPDELMESSSSG